MELIKIEENTKICNIKNKQTKIAINLNWFIIYQNTAVKQILQTQIWNLQPEYREERQRKFLNQC